MSARKEVISSSLFERIEEKAKKIPAIKISGVTFELEAFPLSKDVLEKTKNELRETPENVEKALAEMRELLKGEPDFQVLDDEFFFSKFLRPCKWHAKPAFEFMKRFYHYRVDHPRFGNDLLPSNERALIMSGVITPLPIRDSNGCRLILIEGGKRWKPKELSLDQIFRGVMLFLTAALMEPATQVCGIQVIIDMDGLSLNQVTYYTPSFASAVLNWVQRCLPARLKGIHIINQPFIFNMVFAIFKPFLQEKLRKRLHFHGTDRASLLKHIDAKALPKRYGGDFDLSPEPVGEPLWKYLCLWEEEFIEENRLGYPRKT